MSLAARVIPLSNQSDNIVLDASIGEEEIFPLPF